MLFSTDLELGPRDHKDALASVLISVKVGEF